MFRGTYSRAQLICRARCRETWFLKRMASELFDAADRGEPAAAHWIGRPTARPYPKHTGPYEPRGSATLALTDPPQLWSRAKRANAPLPDPKSPGIYAWYERRLVLLGPLYGRLLHVTYTVRRSGRRIISARMTNLREQRFYERHRADQGDPGP